MKALGSREMTNEELARELGVASGKLYFHTKALLEAGLIERAGTRQKGPRTEKLYRKVGVGFFIPVREDGMAPPLYHFIENALGLYANSWQQANGAGFTQYGYHVMKFLQPDDLAKVVRLVHELLDFVDQSAVGPDVDGAKLVSLSTLAHVVPQEDQH